MSLPIKESFFATEKYINHGCASGLNAAIRRSFNTDKNLIPQTLIKGRKTVCFKGPDSGDLSFNAKTKILSLNIKNTSDMNRAGQVLRACNFVDLRVTTLQINLPEGSDLACPKKLAAALSGNISLPAAACQDSFLLPLLANMDVSKITGFSFEAPISPAAYDALIAKLQDDKFADAKYLKLAGIAFTSAQMVTLLERLKGHTKLEDLNLLGSTVLDDTALRSTLTTFLAETPSLERIGFTVPALTTFEAARGWLTVAQEVGLEQIEGEAAGTYGRKIEGPEAAPITETVVTADDGASAIDPNWAAKAMSGKPNDGKSEA